MTSPGNPENTPLFSQLNSPGLQLHSYFLVFDLQEGTSKFASLESCAKEHQKRTHKRLQLQKEMVNQSVVWRVRQTNTKIPIIHCSLKFPLQCDHV